DIRIPPLRERRGDVLLLATSFLREFAGASAELTPAAMAGLGPHALRGYARERGSGVERAAIVRDGPFIDAEHLSLRLPDDVPTSISTDLGVLERQAIEQALHKTGGNKVRAAKQLGITRTQLYGRLKKYG